MADSLRLSAKYADARSEYNEYLQLSDFDSKLAELDPALRHFQQMLAINPDLGEAAFAQECGKYPAGNAEIRTLNGITRNHG